MGRQRRRLVPMLGRETHSAGNLLLRKHLSPPCLGSKLPGMLAGVPEAWREDQLPGRDDALGTG